MLYNLSALGSISNNDPVFIKTLINLFCESIPVDVKVLNQSFADKDWKQLAFVAHKLKSTIDTLSVESLKQTIRELEVADLKDNLSDAVIHSHIEQVTKVLNEVILELKAHS